VRMSHLMQGAKTMGEQTPRLSSHLTKSKDSKDQISIINLRNSHTFATN